MLRRMYLAYLDDSVSYDKKFQIVGGVILKDEDFTPLETCLGFVIEEYVPEEFRDNFEFHAAELHQSRGSFEKLPKGKGLEIISQAVDMISTLSLPILYGAVDTDKLRTSIWGNAHPLSVGFRICAEAIEGWIQANGVSNQDLGLLIFDEPNNKETKNSIRSAFRDCRSRVKSWTGTRGQLEHIHDDLYFGDSSYSCGIQAADICAYLINRHLNSRDDTEHLYKQLERYIFSRRMEPQ